MYDTVHFLSMSGQYLIVRKKIQPLLSKEISQYGIFIVQNIVHCKKNRILTMIATYSDFRQKLKMYLDEVFKSNRPLFVTRTKGENIVVLSESDYESLMETFYLLKSPKNAERLQQAISQYEKGEGKSRDLIEE